MQFSLHKSQKPNKQGEYPLLPVVDGHIFHPYGKKGNYICSSKSCNVKIACTITNGTICNVEYVSECKEHNHEQKIRVLQNEQQKKQIEEHLKMNILTPTRDIVKSTNTNTTYAKRKMVQRMRGEMVYDMLHDIENSESQFLWRDDKSKMLIYASKTKLSMLKGRRFSFVFMDGSYKSCSKEFCEIYTVHIMFTNGETIPVFHCMLPNKKEETYSICFNKLNSVFISFTGSPLFSPQTSCFLDFESSAFNALLQFTPSIHGCSFHYMKSIYQRIVKLGLKKEFFSNNIFRSLVKKFMHLCYLKKNTILEQFNVIKNTILKNEHKFNNVIYNKMLEFLVYFESTWILSWPIEVWSVALMIISTDNTSEIYHSALNRRVAENHPSTNKLLFHLMAIEEKAIDHLKQMALGNHENQTLRNPWKKRMIHLMEDIVNGSILIDEFFSGMEAISIERNYIEVFEEDEMYQDGISDDHVELKKKVKIPRKARRKVRCIEDNRKNFKVMKRLNKERKQKLERKKQLEIQKESKRKMKEQERKLCIGRKIKTRSRSKIGK